MKMLEVRNWKLEENKNSPSANYLSSPQVEELNGVSHPDAEEGSVQLIDNNLTLSNCFKIDKFIYKHKLQGVMAVNLSLVETL